MAYKAIHNKITINATKFIYDFKLLTSGRGETIKVLKDAGINQNIFYTWKYNSDSNGNLTVWEDTLNKFCDISGLNPEDYIVSRKSTVTKSKKKSYTKKLNGGSEVTTYIKSAAKKTRNFDKNELHSKLTSFTDNMSIYRTLLNLSEDTLVAEHNIDNYVDIENKKSVLSLSTYFTISSIFIATYNNMEECPTKNAFRTLAKAYNDIYIGSIYFGDI